MYNVIRNNLIQGGRHNTILSRYMRLTGWVYAIASTVLPSGLCDDNNYDFHRGKGKPRSQRTIVTWLFLLRSVRGNRENIH